MLHLEKPRAEVPFLILCLVALREGGALFTTRTRIAAIFVIKPGVSLHFRRGGYQLARFIKDFNDSV